MKKSPRKVTKRGQDGGQTKQMKPQKKKKKKKKKTVLEKEALIGCCN
jgi:hypothetical protein